MRSSLYFFQNKQNLNNQIEFPMDLGVCFLREAFFVAHVLDDSFFIWLLPLQFNFIWIRDIWINKQLACLRKRPVLWHNVLFGVDVFQNLFNRLVLFNKIDSSFGSDAFNRVAIITAQQDTQINKLNSKNNILNVKKKNQF
jgi:hypothetical protein